MKTTEKAEASQLLCQGQPCRHSAVLSTICSCDLCIFYPQRWHGEWHLQWALNWEKPL